MNLMEVIALLIIVLFAAGGLRRGFVRKLASILSLVGSIVLVSLVLPHMTQFLKEQTPVYSYIVERCQSAAVFQIGDSAPDALMLPDEAQAQIIQNLPLPEFLQKQLVRHNNSEGYLELGVSTFQDYVINYAAAAILNALAFILAVMLVHAVIWIAVSLLEKLTHVPGISLLNRLAGGALGLLQGLFVLCLLFLLLSVFEAVPQVQGVLEMVRKSAVLNFLYETNLFLRIALRAAAVFA